MCIKIACALNALPVRKPGEYILERLDQICFISCFIKIAVIEFVKLPPHQAHTTRTSSTEDSLEIKPLDFKKINRK